MSEEAITQFARELVAEVDEVVRAGTSGVYSEEEFTRILLERLADEGAFENPIPLWQEGSFGRAKYKITGYALTEDEERLLLTTTVYTGEVAPRSLARDVIVTAVRQAVRFYESSCKGLHEQIEPSNTDASDLARRIYEARDRISILRVVLLSDALTGLDTMDFKEAFDGARVLVDLFGMERIYRILGEGLGRDDIHVDFEKELGAPLPCLKTSGDGADYEAFLAAIPGEMLADIYHKYGTRLLELNVRAFLGLRGGRKSVNAGLRATIREAPHRFLAYNNGIVATADSVELIDAGNGTFGLRALRGLQIVNGGQTTASLHRAKRQDRARLDAVAVPMKLIRVGGSDLDEMVATVSRSANSQNTIQPADFSANDPLHIEVEKLANNTWLPDGSGRWFYERARGSYGAAELKASFSAPQKRRFAKETPKERRFSKPDLAKYLNAWNGAPHLVSLGSQKNFQAFMQNMKNSHPDGFKPDTEWFKAFIAKAILFQTVTRLARDRKFPAYQPHITAYTVDHLSWRTGGRIDFELVWSSQQISPELKSMLDAWTLEVDDALRRTAGSRMPSEWAKKEGCRDAFRELTFPFPDSLPPELTAQATLAGKTGKPTRNDSLTAADLKLISLCRDVSAENWLRVAQWGKKTKEIHWRLAGIAQTMGEYAIGGWERSPSAKQAKWAMEAYKAAEQARALAED